MKERLWQRYLLFVAWLIGTRVTASFWRCFLMRRSFAWRFRFPRASALCWRGARILATENTHAALAAYSAGILMNEIMNGEA